MYVEYLDRNYACPATIRNIVSHMRQYLTLVGAPTDEAHHYRVKRALDALDRDSTYVPQPRPPVPLDMFKQAVLSLPKTTEGTLVRAAVLTMFHGAMRRSEVCPPSTNTFNPRFHLTRADVTIHAGGVTIRIRHAKNAQKYNQTQTRHLTRSPDPLLCPWRALKAAVDIAPTKYTDDPMLMFPDGNPVSAAYVAEQWAIVLTQVGAPPEFHRLHSLRKAAAKSAYKSGATIQEVKDFGGWRSSAVWAYVQKNSSTNISKTLVKNLSSI